MEPLAETATRVVASCAEATKDADAGKYRCPLLKEGGQCCTATHEQLQLARHLERSHEAELRLVQQLAADLAAMQPGTPGQGRAPGCMACPLSCATSSCDGCQHGEKQLRMATHLLAAHTPQLAWMASLAAHVLPPMAPQATAVCNAAAAGTNSSGAADSRGAGAGRQQAGGETTLLRRCPVAGCGWPPGAPDQLSQHLAACHAAELARLAQAVTSAAADARGAAAAEKNDRTYKYSCPHGCRGRAYHFECAFLQHLLAEHLASLTQGMALQLSTERKPGNTEQQTASTPTARAASSPEPSGSATAASGRTSAAAAPATPPPSRPARAAVGEQQADNATSPAGSSGTAVLASSGSTSSRKGTAGAAPSQPVAYPAVYGSRPPQQQPVVYPTVHGLQPAAQQPGGASGQPDSPVRYPTVYYTRSDGAQAIESHGSDSTQPGSQLTHSGTAGAASAPVPPAHVPEASSPVAPPGVHGCAQQPRPGSSAAAAASQQAVAAQQDPAASQAAGHARQGRVGRLLERVGFGGRHRVGASLVLAPEETTAGADPLAHSPLQAGLQLPAVSAPAPLQKLSQEPAAPATPPRASHGPGSLAPAASDGAACAPPAAGTPDAAPPPINERCVRIASWNLKHFTFNGREDELVKLKAIARDIARSGADIVALQEIDRWQAVQTLCGHVQTEPEAIRQGGTWHFRVSDPLGSRGRAERGAFLWRHTSQVQAWTVREDGTAGSDSCTRSFWQLPDVRREDLSLNRSPFFGAFRVAGARQAGPLVLVNCHLAADTNVALEIGKLGQLVNEGAAFGQRLAAPASAGAAADAAACTVLPLGDFNRHPAKSAWAGWLGAGWRHCVPAELCTNLVDNDHYDDVWLPAGLYQHCRAAGALPPPDGLVRARASFPHYSDHLLVWTDLAQEAFLRSKRAGTGGGHH